MLAAVGAPEVTVRPLANRAPAPDLSATLEHDRRARGERIIELGRWVVLIFAAVTVNFPTPVISDVGDVNLVLGAWALFNLAVTLTLIAKRLPGRHTQWAMTALDVGVATALVYLTGGLQSSLGLTFYAVVVASSLRFGLRGSLFWAVIVAACQLGAGVAAVGTLTRTSLDVYLSHVFLYALIALTSSLLAREMVTSRARQLAHTFQLEHAAFNELREVDKLKSEFIMLASHELRTPLAKIKAWLSLMQEGGDRLPPTAQREGIEVLRSEAEHLARLTDNLLCIAQLEAGEIRLKTGPVNIEQVFEQVVARFVETADRCRFEFNLDRTALFVLADRERLSLLLACLVDNALKFSPESEPVRINSRRQGLELRIDIVDNGRKIPDEQKDRIFASFYQMESPLSRQRGGCGVGLYLARQLVERMGGKVWVENPRARGNTFAVTLPADI